MLAKHEILLEGIVITRRTIRVPLLILLFVLCLGPSLTPSRQDSQCVCGIKKTLLVLADFPEYPHISSSSEIATLFARVARYFHDVSYGRLTVVGNATDWISLPKLYSQYAGPDIHATLVNIAQDAFYSASQSFNMSSFDFFVMVLSFYPSLTGDFMPSYDHPIHTKTGTLPGFAVIEEDRDWSAYARGFALSFGLWRFETELSGMQANDLAASGEGDMSAWSKVALGWVNDSQLLTLDTPVVNRILTLDPVEDPSEDGLALRIRLGANLGEYWVEVRQPLGYDRNLLPGYGAVVSFVPPSNGSIQLKKILQPEIVSGAVFLDPDADLSIIALNVTQGRYRLLVGDAQVGRDAQVAVYSLSRAQDAINAAEMDNRFENLSIAQDLFDKANALFNLGRFQDAGALAISAETMAATATVPPDYAQAAQLLAAGQVLRNQTASTRLNDSPLVQEANVQLDIATRAFEARDFALTKQAAQSAIDLFNKARQSELINTILDWLSNLALIAPIIILAFALRHQLKGE